MFREMKDVIKHEFIPKEPQKIEFELKEDESDSITEEYLERTIREEMDLEDGKLWKEAMVDEMASLHKNEAMGSGGVVGLKEAHREKMGV